MASKATASKSASKSTARSSTRSSRSRSAPTKATEKQSGLPSGTLIAGGRQSPEDRVAERDALQPTQVQGPGSGNRLLGADGKELKLSDVAGEKGDVLVTLTQDVKEEHPIPGSDRMGTSLLFHKGQRVPLSTLERHFAAQEGKRAPRSSENKSAAGRVTETK